MADFGELKPLKPRSVWRNEASDFTPWLAENIASLGEVLGMDLEVVATEAEVGAFSLDIRAKDLGTGRQVVIENQFGSTDHDHLGKLLTYAAGLDATAVILVAENVRDEHRQALDWLNRRTDSETHFFAVTVEVFQIDDSRPAFAFKPVVFPNEWQRTTREAAERAASPRGEAYRQFFQGLIDEMRVKHQFTGARAGQPQNWYSFASGVSGATYDVAFGQAGRIRAGVYLDYGDVETNKTRFDLLQHDRAAIERAFGESLSWERLDDRRACRIAAYRDGSIDDPAEHLAEIRTWVEDRLLKLQKVFAPRLRGFTSDRGPRGDA